MYQGRCACGQVRYQVGGDLRDVYNCHCSRCRRISGHYLATTACDVADLTIENDLALRWWSADGTADYGFCGTCGSTLFWRAASTPARMSIAAGTLDGPTLLRTTQAWWCAEAADYHELPTGTERHSADGG